MVSSPARNVASAFTTQSVVARRQKPMAFVSRLCQPRSSFRGFLVRRRRQEVVQGPDLSIATFPVAKRQCPIGIDGEEAISRHRYRGGLDPPRLAPIDEYLPQLTVRGALALFPHQNRLAVRRPRR